MDGWMMDGRKIHIHGYIITSSERIWHYFLLDGDYS